VLFGKLRGKEAKKHSFISRQKIYSLELSITGEVIFKAFWPPTEDQVSSNRGQTRQASVSIEMNRKVRCKSELGWYLRFWWEWRWFLAVKWGFSA
jgi:hypothetical protein